ncbi:hypothetical protein COO60DRAFT_1274422, partial [Scenedesmus sp. NREL 46B-D3]
VVQYSRMFMAVECVSREDVAEFCDAFNAKAVMPERLQQWAAEDQAPRVVCLRNEVRRQLNWTLACLLTQKLGMRPIVWFARDVVSPGRGRKLPVDPTAEVPALPRAVRDAMAFMKPEDTEGVGSMQDFFPGCVYTFSDNAVPQLGMVNNAECVGVDLVLAPGEVDDGKHGCWFLKRPPVAVFVKPVGTPMSQVAWHMMRANFLHCLKGVCLSRRGGLSQGSQVQHNVRRFGMNLSDAYAVTDYCCQGVSFKLDAWLAHLNLPPTGGGLQRAAVFVDLTRWGAWEHVALLCPLWAAGDTDARNRVIYQFHELACLEPDLRIELTRLKMSPNRRRTRQSSGRGGGRCGALVLTMCIKYVCNARRRSHNCEELASDLNTTTVSCQQTRHVRTSNCTYNMR